MTKKENDDHVRRIIQSCLLLIRVTNLSLVNSAKERLSIRTQVSMKSISNFPIGHRVSLYKEVISRCEKSMVNKRNRQFNLLTITKVPTSASRRVWHSVARGSLHVPMSPCLHVYRLRAVAGLEAPLLQSSIVLITLSCQNIQIITPTPVQCHHRRA